MKCFENGSNLTTFLNSWENNHSFSAKWWYYSLKDKIFCLLTSPDEKQALFSVVMLQTVEDTCQLVAGIFWLFYIPSALVDIRKWRLSFLFRSWKDFLTQFHRVSTGCPTLTSNSQTSTGVWEFNSILVLPPKNRIRFHK